MQPDVIKQAVESPAYPDVEWGRPETAAQVAPIIIVGGYRHGFSAPATAYDIIKRMGPVKATVLLPNSVSSVVPHEHHVDFLPVTPSGTFNQELVGEVVSRATDDSVICLIGQTGHNSETAIALESVLVKARGTKVITGSALDQTINNVPSCSVIVASVGQLQALTKAHKVSTTITHDMTFNNICDNLAHIASTLECHIVVALHEQLFYSDGQDVIVSPGPSTDQRWQIDTTARITAWLAYAHAETKKLIACALI